MLKMTIPEFVSFEVGGKSYRVAKDTIQLHEGSTLDRLVLETWKPEPNQEDSHKTRIYLDRDGDRFGYVLDFLR